MRVKNLFPQKIKNIYHLCQAILASFFYGFPASRRRVAISASLAESRRASRGGSSRKIKVIGVTGTNGKTTTVQMITRILEEAGHKVAMSSTINFKLGEKEWVNATKYTTLSSFSVQKFIKQAAEARCQYLVLEVSSHSLDQYRLWGINFDVAVITNVTREHLDYHKDMEQYRRAKLKLFKKAKIAVVNLDMKKPEEFLDYKVEEKYGFAICHPGLACPALAVDPGSRGLDSGSPASPSLGGEAGMTIIKADNIKLGINESEFKIKNLEFKIYLPGLFNIENALAATCVGLSQGIRLEVIKVALEKIKGVPGRMEHVPNSRNIEIIIDYAVTPDSLNKLYELIRRINTGKGKIIAILGACGERDRGKRPIMGEIVAKYADYIILTNEDPYNEDPWRIINEIVAGIKNKEENINYWKIMDRREAIKKALQLAKPGDYIVITGKGAEETMAIGKKRIPWNDKKVILEELAKKE